jgi:hypothetical protein
MIVPERNRMMEATDFFGDSGGHVWRNIWQAVKEAVNWHDVEVKIAILKFSKSRK